MTTITCKTCGHSFETEARTNTRCRSCKAVVRIPARAQSAQLSGVLVLLLGCGDVVALSDPGVPAADAGEYVWDCEECGAQDQEVRTVVASLSETESAALDDEAFDAFAEQACDAAGVH